MPKGFKPNACADALRLISIALAIIALVAAPITSPAIAAHPVSNLSPDFAQDGASDFHVTFVEVAARAGLTEPIIYGGIDKKKYIIETNGCGVAFLDYDNDGWMDILLLNGTRLEGFPKGKEPTLKLYHNNRNGAFTDATAGSGLTRTGWASAVTVGDYDNDGYDDVLITY